MKKKTLFIILFALAVTAFFSLWLFSDVSLTKEEKVAKSLEKDREHLELVAEYLLNEPGKYLSFLDDSGCFNGGYITSIENAEVMASVKQLLNKRNYKKVIKDGDTVRFIRWTRLSDYEAGICYTPEGAPKIEFLTTEKSLSVKGWYYYEADYNKWRTDNHY